MLFAMSAIIDAQLNLQECDNSPKIFRWLHVVYHNESMEILCVQFFVIGIAQNLRSVTG